MKPIVTLIVANYNGYSVTNRCLESIIQTTPGNNYEIIVVDNASSDSSLSRLKETFGRNKLIRFIGRKNNGFITGAYNSGLQSSRGSIVVFMNNDLIFRQPWLDKLVSLFEDNRVGLAGLVVVNFNTNLIENMGGKLNLLGYGVNVNQGNRYKQSDSIRQVDYIPGTLIAGRTNLIQSVGGFDKLFGGNYEDVDLALRLKKLGYKAVATQNTYVIHLGSWSVKRFTKSYHSAYLCRRNRLLTLLINYSKRRLATVLPCYLALQLVIFIKELFYDWDFKLALTTPQALLWVFKNYPKLYSNIK